MDCCCPVSRQAAAGGHPFCVGQLFEQKNDVREWIKNWNKDPKPFIWTKTAEDILLPLAKYIAKISGAGH